MTNIGHLSPYGGQPPSPGSGYPIIRYEAAVRVPIAVTFSCHCGKCGALTENRPSMAQDGLPARLCTPCYRKLFLKPWAKRLAILARCKAKEGVA